MEPGGGQSFTISTWMWRDPEFNAKAQILQPHSGPPNNPAYPHRDRKGAVSDHYAVTAPFRSRYGVEPHFRKVRL